MNNKFGETNKMTEHHRPTMVYDPKKEFDWDYGEGKRGHGEIERVLAATLK